MSFSNGGAGAVVGLAIYHQFNVTVQNRGESNITELTLVVEMLGYNDNHVVWNYSEKVENLIAGEVREIVTGAWTNVDDIMSPPGITFIVALISGSAEIAKYAANYDVYLIR